MNKIKFPTAIFGGPASLVAVALILASLGFSEIFAADRAVKTVGSDMEQRLKQVINVLRKGNSSSAIGAAIDSGMEILYGGMRVLPTKGVPKSLEAHYGISRAEMDFAAALEAFVNRKTTKGADDQKGRALDLKLFIEQMNEVARAVSKFTQKCGVGDSLEDPLCAELQPLLDQQTGQEHEPLNFAGVREKQANIAHNTKAIATVFHPGYSVNLRSPFIPRWFSGWKEDVRVTQAIAPYECAVVFKETRGLMLRLRLVRIIIVRDAWVSTFGVPRGTRIPVWTLEPVPSEYVKQWNMCNEGKGRSRMHTTVTQRVVQDIPLKYFWRFYH